MLTRNQCNFRYTNDVASPEISARGKELQTRTPASSSKVQEVQLLKRPNPKASFDIVDFYKSSKI